MKISMTNRPLTMLIGIHVGLMPQARPVMKHNPNSFFKKIGSSPAHEENPRKPAWPLGDGGPSVWPHMHGQEAQAAFPL